MIFIVKESGFRKLKINPFACGHYGISRVYRVGRFRVGYRFRTKSWEIFYLGTKRVGFPVFSRLLPLRYEQGNQFNKEVDVCNRTVLASLPKDKKIVFFVTDNLMAAGGVERRFLLQFDWLMEHGVQPVLVLWEQKYEPLNKYPVIHLAQWAPNACETLLSIVKEALQKPHL